MFVSKTFPEGGESGIPLGKVIDFTLGGASLSLKDGCCGAQVYSGPENPTAAAAKLSAVTPI